MNKRKLNKEGFTLIEIIISIALIGIIVIALLSVISYSTRVLFASGEYMKENYVLQQELENFISGDIFDDDYDAITEDLTLNITWASPIGVEIDDFTVNGKTMYMTSDSLVQGETFYVFYSQEVSPSEPK